MGQLIFELVFILMFTGGGIYVSSIAAEGGDFVRIPLPKSLHKILAGYSERINREEKYLEQYKPQDISLARLIWCIFTFFGFIIWLVSFVDINNIFTIESLLVLYKLMIAFFIGSIGTGVYLGICNSIRKLLTSDGKYKYNEKMPFKYGSKSLKLHMKNVETGKKAEITICFPEKIASSYYELFGSTRNGEHDWWIVLENASSKLNYKYIATIGIWDLKKPNRLFEYAIDVESETSTLIRDYIENPEA